MPEDTYPILDGWLFKAKLRCSLTFLSLAIREYEALRRAGAYRTKIWCFPKDSQTFQVPARSSLELQTRVKPGSAIWGYCFVADTVEDPGNGELQVQSFEVRDGCDDQAVFSEPNTRQVETPAPTQLLSKMVVAGPPGLLNVVIASTFDTAQTTQLLLFGGEPVA